MPAYLFLQFTLSHPVTSTTTAEQLLEAHPNTVIASSTEARDVEHAQDV